MNYIIVSGGYPPQKKILDAYLKGANKLIGVDGAADFFESEGIKADVLLGDFDTADESNVRAQEKKGARIIRLETKKNLTDTEAALRLALDEGASGIILLGAIGSRMDHTLSNISLLKLAYEQGTPMKIHNKKQRDILM